MGLLEWILKYCDTYMPLLTLIFSFFIFKNIDKKEYILLIYVLTCFVIFLITNIMADYDVNNMYFYHFFSLFEVGILGYYFSRLLLKKSITLYWFILSGYVIFWFINILIFESFNLFNSNSSVVANLIVLLLSMNYLFEISRSEDVLYFQRLPGFWIGSAFLVSCALSIFGFVAYRYIQANEDFKGYGNKIRMVSLFSIIFRFALITIGLLCYKRHRSISST